MFDPDFCVLKVRSIFLSFFMVQYVKIRTFQLFLKYFDFFLCFVVPEICFTVQAGVREYILLDGDGQVFRA